MVIKKYSQEIEKINNRIKKEICYETIFILSDENLTDDYKNSKSVKKQISALDCILTEYLNENTKQDVIKRMLVELSIIPPGTKAVIKSLKFNKIVKNCITSLNLDSKKFEIMFEKKCSFFLTEEIPDWYILEKITNKIIIGMNQIDLWSGGHQLNRGFKYLINNKYNTNLSKLLCVICSDCDIKNTNNKVYKLFKSGFENNTLCYMNNLKNIILTFFT